MHRTHPRRASPCTASGQARHPGAAHRRDRSARRVRRPAGRPAVPGLVRAMTLVVVTRLHNARRRPAGCVGSRLRPRVRRRAARRRRRVGDLAAAPGHPGHPRCRRGGRVRPRGHAFALFGRVEVGADPAAAAELRIVAPLAKLATGRLAVSSASEYVESFGGAGYVEDTGVPRLLRDAQVLPIWEGTTNVLALDVLRALTRRTPGPLLSRLAAAVDLARPLSPVLADTLAAAATQLGDTITAVTADPGAPAVLAGAGAWRCAWRTR
ncbi:acyl-CoA dehydrogenase family protein [Micromonospora sp. M12]